jgi:Arc-like DNA binding domain
MTRKPTEIVHLKLRFEEKLRRRLERAAESKGHSMNTEIIERLEHSFQAKSIEDVVKAAMAEEIKGLRQMNKLLHDEIAMLIQEWIKERARGITSENFKVFQAKAPDEGSKS